MPSFTDTLNAARDAIKAVSSIDDRIKLMDALDALSELHMENNALKEENRMLREKLAARKRLERRGAEVYILEDDGTETGPICPQCYGADGIVMLLERANGGARCSRCKARYAGVDPAVEGFKTYAS